MSPADQPDEGDPGDDEVPPALRALVNKLPTDPGVYLMKDKKGRVVYVGKARNLRARVRSYFTRSSSDTRAFVALLGRLLGDIETVVVASEKEALLLENNLLKQHRPRFNVKLRDDKQYLVLRLDPSAKWPRLELVRRMAQDGARYFGPYHSATGARETLRVVNRHFKLRTCTDHVLETRKRPCLQYQIKRCPAPCVYPVDAGEYGEQVRDVTLFLHGKRSELTDRLRTRMQGAAGAQRFEQAASLRDQLFAVERTLEAQRVVSTEFTDQDVFGLYREGDVVVIAVLAVRQGKLLGSQAFPFDGQEFPDAETLSSFIGLYYDLAGAVPDELLLPLEIEDAEAKAEWLRDKAGGSKKVEVLVPQRGARKQLIELAAKNAASAHASRRSQEDDAMTALEKLQDRLGLRRVPRRIECYDIAHLQGAQPVASMVVFVDGLPAKSEYRKFKLKSVANDDFAAMYETLSRRFRRAREEAKANAVDGAGEGGGEGKASRWAAPDLVVIDGGKGQLGVVLAALRDVGIATSGDKAFDVIALAKERVQEMEDAPSTSASTSTSTSTSASTSTSTSTSTAAEDVAEYGKVLEQVKEVDEAAIAAAEDAALAAAGGTGDAEPVEKPRRKSKGRARGKTKDDARERMPDRVFLPRAKDAIRLRPNTSELFLLARVRDEAHRFANTFHRQQRKQSTLRSALEDVPGVGAKRQRELLRRFGSVERLRHATLPELAAAPGMTRASARAVYEFLRRGAPAPAPADPVDAPENSDE
ncbi:MAG: excinuclease ABC subunit UvrC [Deltaproteobacteria bacterium]|nr:excinuclease ABC subunit UvrC [Deltaproteobacteria bacterium]